MKKILIALIFVITGLLIYSIFANDNAIDKSISIDKILLEKGKRQLSIYAKDDLIKTYKVSLDGDPIGPKEIQGDKRTPEGNYFINGKNPNSDFHKKLGISYPNQKDIDNAKKTWSECRWRYKDSWYEEWTGMDRKIAFNDGLDFRVYCGN